MKIKKLYLFRKFIVKVEICLAFLAILIFVLIIIGSIFEFDPKNTFSMIIKIGAKIIVALIFLAVLIYFAIGHLINWMLKREIKLKYKYNSFE